MSRVDVDDPGAGEGFDSAADDGLDLTPRTGPASGPRRGRSRRTSPLAYVVLALIAAGVVFVVYQGLGNATLYFRNVDEAVAERESLGTRDFRVQGLVTSEPVTRADGIVEFTVTFNQVDLPVESSVGPPSDLFALGKPVVLEGHFAEDAAVFEAHRILVKHDETYEADNGGRIDDAEDGEGAGTEP